MPFNLFSSIDPNTMVLLFLFVIIFAMLMFLLGRTMFKENNSIKTVIAMAISLFAIYGINKMNWDVSNFFYSLGLSQDLIYIIVPWLIIAFVIFISFVKDKTTMKKKFRLSRPFLIIGALLTIISFTSLILQKGVVMIVGIVMLIIGILLSIFKKKDNVNPNTNPQNNSAPNEGLLREQGIANLTNAAKYFKNWALKQPNPKFVGSWAMFINYLKQNRYGRNEKEICQKLHISKRDFVKIFNRYGKV